MKRTKKAAVIATCMSLCAAILAGTAGAPVAAHVQPVYRPVAILTVISGEVLIRAQGHYFSLATDGAVLYVGTTLRTSADAQALITLVEGSTLELDPASDITIEDVTMPSGSTIAQALGRGWQVVTRLTTADSRFGLKTPASTASVRGIEFEIAAADALDGLTMMLTTQPVITAVAGMPSVELLAPTTTTAVRSTSVLMSTLTTTPGAERIRKIFTTTSVVRAPLAERSRDRDSERAKD
ncbi:MAG: FecR domain-containing protein [Chloroflexota bacterium]